MNRAMSVETLEPFQTYVVPNVHTKRQSQTRLLSPLTNLCKIHNQGRLTPLRRLNFPISLMKIFRSQLTQRKKCILQANISPEYSLIHRHGCVPESITSTLVCVFFASSSAQLPLPEFTRNNKKLQQYQN